MAAEKICFKDYVECKDDKMLSKTRKKINRKRKDGSSKNVYGWAGNGPAPNLSGAPAGGADGGGAAGGVGESYILADVDGVTPRLKNVFKYGRSKDMRFRDFMQGENEEEFDADIDPEEPVDDQYGEEDDDKFDKDIYDLIKELEEDGLSVEDIADETDLSVEEIEDYLEHFDVQDEYSDEPEQGYGEEDDYPDEDMGGDFEEEDEEERFDLDKALERSRFASRGRKLGPDQEDEVEDFHTRMRKERGGLRGGGFNPEDEEEDDHNNAFASFDRNRERGDEIDDFMSSKPHRGAMSPEDDDDDAEEREYDDILDAMDRRRRERRDDELSPGENPTRFLSRDGMDPADELDNWSDEDEEATRVADDEMDDDEFERRYDVERDEMDEEDPEYADEVQAGDWTITRIDDEGDFDEDSYDEQDRDEYDRGEEDEMDFDADPEDGGRRSTFDTVMSSEEDEEAYAEDAEEPSKKDQARALYRAMKSGEYTRKDIINAFEKRLQLSPSSSTAYYERIAKEYGETEQQGEMDPTGGMGMGGMGAGGMGDMMGDETMMGDEEPEYQDVQDWEDEHRQGVIRNVKSAHLVYKRQADDGSFEELWLYNEGDKFQDEISIRHDILAGTDIPVNKTQSPDGSQKSEAWSIGDVQYMNITGLPN